MCRLAAFPPGYSREGAISIMESYGEYNKDGVGIAYAKDGELVVKKFPTSWETITKRKVDIFAHMPHDGWTIAHVRAATHGEKTPENTHPFIKGDWAVCHNGIYSGHRIARELLTEMGSVFTGQTDSEAGAELINRFGPKRFPRFASSHDGTWLALNKNGELYVVVTGGQCDLFKLKGTKGQFLVASSLSNEGVKSVDSGWIRFNKNGKQRAGKFKLEKSYSYGGYAGTTSFPTEDLPANSHRGSFPRPDFSKPDSPGKQPHWSKVFNDKWRKKAGEAGSVVTYEDLQRGDSMWMGD